MNNKRRFDRFETELKALYNVREHKQEWEQCTIINMSRKGMGLQFHSPAEIPTGISIQLEIFIPEKPKTISVEGVLRWTDRREGGLFGGVECNEILDEMKFSKLA